VPVDDATPRVRPHALHGWAPFDDEALLDNACTVLDVASGY
jgi:hypothetical protein